MVEANNDTHHKEMESSSTTEDTKVTSKKEAEAKVVDEHPLFKHIADNNLEAVRNCLEVIIFVAKILAATVFLNF
jgi:hypothetical protein